MRARTNGRGRPRKYDRPSRAITLTLPEDVLARLSGIDPDLGQAIVGLVERRGTGRPHAPAELATFGAHSVIVVTPVKALKRLPGVQLVPMSHGRALISLDDPHAIPQLELDLRDAIDRDDIPDGERAILRSLAEMLRRARRAPGVSVEERTIIVLEAKRQR